MSERRTYDVSSWRARGKPVEVTAHAWEGMNAERPPVRSKHLVRVLEEPDGDENSTAYRRFGQRTIIVHYKEEEDAIFIRSVSATRRRLRP